MRLIQNLCSRIGRVFLSDMASECHINWDFINGFKQAREEGNEAAFVAFVDLFNSTDFDLFRDAYMGEAKDEETLQRNT